MHAFVRTISLAICLLVTIAALPADCQSAADDAAGAAIPERSIARLADELEEASELESTTEARRACKNIVRRAESLIERYPQSPDRFRVFKIIFDTRKLMFTLRQSEENRDALVAAAKALLELPDEQALLRVEPDMLLLQAELARLDDDADKSALALAQFADRYRNTPAEARSLIMSSAVAFNLGNPFLLKAFRQTLENRFRQDPEVAAFLRERFAMGGDVHLSGTFETAQGKRIAFPLGRTVIACFWSQDAPRLAEQVAQIKALEERHKDQFEVYSFNLDELRDCGRGALKRMGVSWVAVNLPGGDQSPLYRSIGGTDGFSVLVVGPHGVTKTSATGKAESAASRQIDALSRMQAYAPILQSLCVGDYLARHALDTQTSDLPAETLDAIRACFPNPPARYALTTSQALENYAKADQLCAEAIEKRADAKEIQRVRSAQMVALLGRWRLTGEVDYLDRAVAGAKVSADSDHASQARVVAEFCLATKSIVAPDADVEAVLTGFIDASGQDEAAQAMRCAAAMMLSLEAHSSESYVRYRDQLIERYADEPAVETVTAFLLEPSISAALFEKALPGTDSRPLQPAALRKQFAATVTPANGQSRQLGKPQAGRLTAIVFMDSLIVDPKNPNQKTVIDYLAQSVKRRPQQDLELVGVFQSRDAEKIEQIMTGHKWSFATATIDERAWSAMSARYALAGVDRTAGVFVVGPDGKTLLAMTALSPDTQQPQTYIHRIASALRDYDTALAERAYAAKDYRAYADRLAISFPLPSRARSRHPFEANTPIEHRRKLIWALMQVGDWPAALKAADENVAANVQPPNQRNPIHNGWCRHCYSPVFNLFMLATLQQEIGEKDKAAALRRLAESPQCPHKGDLQVVWAEAGKSIADRRQNRRFAHLKDPKAHILERERETRRSSQALYKPGLAQDLLLRVQIKEKLGQNASAEQDRTWAEALVWPCPVPPFDMENLHSASAARRKAARELLKAKRWQQVLALADKNVRHHEAEAIRCDSACKICRAQNQAFGYRAATLEQMGRDQAQIDEARAMAEAARCPSVDVGHTFSYFAVNRMYGGGEGQNRLNFIEDYMLGGSYALRGDRELRLELVEDLMLRASAYEGLGKTHDAAKDRLRATALAYPYGPDAIGDARIVPTRYVDVLSNPAPDDDSD